ncbi:hypothetical protein SB775_19240 [Peribacillus sp. SIMBA_075]|uniref:hypothetical protein n=1 Tax=Peribacillus sp. SIMBA_075 TaxID=3085813 RepID=UPI00397B890E
MKRCPAYSGHLFLLIYFAVRGSNSRNPIEIHSRAYTREIGSFTREIGRLLVSLVHLLVNLARILVSLVRILVSLVRILVSLGEYS